MLRIEPEPGDVWKLLDPDGPQDDDDPRVVAAMVHSIAQAQEVLFTLAHLQRRGELLQHKVFAPLPEVH